LERTLALQKGDESISYSSILTIPVPLQEWHLSKPLPLQEVQTFLSSSNAPGFLTEPVPWHAWQAICPLPSHREQVSCVII
jgi:hypothetical protein